MSNFLYWGIVAPALVYIGAVVAKWIERKCERRWDNVVDLEEWKKK